MFVYIFQYKIDCRVTIELLDTETEENPEKTVEGTTKWSDYVDNLKNPLISSIVIDSSVNNNVGNNIDNFQTNNMEMKTESPDEETVSFNLILTYDVHDLTLFIILNSLK